MNEKFLDKLMESYDEYWDKCEIDIDLANQLVEAVPQLIDEIKKLRHTRSLLLDEISE